MIRTDEQLKKSIVDHLFWDDSIDSSRVKIEVTNGKATLTGYVLTMRAKDGASSAAWLVNGISDVDNQLQVQFHADLPVLTNDEIQQNAVHSLAWNGDVHSLAISISVTAGVVNLEGIVPSYWQKDKAEKIVSDLLGVVDVNNDLIVVPTKFLTDKVIAENIHRAIKNSTKIDGQHIKVSVQEGTVSLKGSVNNGQDRIQAITICANCRGVVDIINKLKVLSP
jgi:osmotically-inducible protein OsmY